MCYIVHMKEISIRELHLETGPWVRAAHKGTPVVIKDRGRPVATLVPFAPEHGATPFAERILVKGFAELPPTKGDCTESISDDRNRA